MPELETDQEIEELQVKAKKRILFFLVIASITFLCTLIVGTLAMVFSGENFFLAILQVLIVDVVLHGLWGAVFYFLIVNRTYQQFNTTFKSRYVLKTIEETKLFEDLSYDMKQGFDYDTIRNSAVVNCANKRYFASEDMLSGRYKNIQFHLSDVTTRKLVTRHKRSSVETVFNGQIMRFAVFDDWKVSDEYLQVFEKEFLSDFRGWTAANKIETEYEAFNKKFHIYADNEHNAFYILTPQLMEKCLAFSESIGEQIAISFYGSVMFVAINRFGSIFDGKIDVPIAQQKALILNDIKILQTAGDILLHRHCENSKY